VKEALNLLTVVASVSMLFARNYCAIAEYQAPLVCTVPCTLVSKARNNTGGENPLQCNKGRMAFYDQLLLLSMSKTSPGICSRKLPATYADI
jgi:hypothetical protein